MPSEEPRTRATRHRAGFNLNYVRQSCLPVSVMILLSVSCRGIKADLKEARFDGDIAPPATRRRKNELNGRSGRGGEGYVLNLREAALSSLAVSLFSLTLPSEYLYRVRVPKCGLIKSLALN